MTTVTYTEAEELLAALAGQYTGEAFDPARDITKQILADHLGIAPQAAYDLLQAEVRAGRMLRRFVRLDGKRVGAYRKK